VRFDRRRGYGFIQPDDGAEDVFVHQNNINMEGFRYLQVGEKVSYELEVGEKGMKAVGVTLTEPRVPRPESRDDERGDERGYDEPREFGVRMREPRPAPAYRAAPRAAAAAAGNDDASYQLDKLRRKHERLISLLVEKGVLTPSEIDGLDQAKTAPAAI
jgi:cold shock CspA family protein